MNQENNPNLEDNNNTKLSNSKPHMTAEGLNLKDYNTLIPKTVAELAAIQARGRKLFVKKNYRQRKNLNALQKPREKTKEELRLDAIQRQKDIAEYKHKIGYSTYYFDDKHEYRHVILPKILAKWLPHHGLLKESEWIAIGVNQSTGWEHYMVYAPEPHILLFRREIGYLSKHVIESQVKVQEKMDNKEQNAIKSKQEITTESTQLPLQLLESQQAQLHEEDEPVKASEIMPKSKPRANKFRSYQ